MIDGRHKKSAVQWGVAGLLAAAGAALIWIATPWNNFVLANAFISDSYLPVAAMAVLFFAILGLNPLFKRFVPAAVLGGRQLAFVLGVLLIASVPPSAGLLRQLPYAVASATQRISADPQLSEAVGQSRLPPVLFPDPLRYDTRPAAADGFVGGLNPGEPIPWRNWAGPALALGALAAASWLMMIGLALVVFPQWRFNERLPFPLLNVFHALVSDPEGSPGDSVFKSKSFWIASLAVVAVHSLNGLSDLTGGACPRIPLAWDLSTSFRSGLWQYVSDYVYVNKGLYFTLIGIAFFMPNRIGFSIWVTAIGYGVYEMVVRVFFPPHLPPTISDQRTGAMLAVAIGVLWLGRAHWVRVARSLWVRPADEEGRRDRFGGWMFLLGCLALLAWFLWAGVPPIWALAFVAILVVVALVIARVVSETGYPFVRCAGLSPLLFIKLVPEAWLSAAVILVGGLVDLVGQLASRVSVSVMALLAFGADKQATPRHHRRLAMILIAVLVVGFFVAGAIHMRTSAGASTDISRASAIAWSTEQMNSSLDMLRLWGRHGEYRPAYSQAAHIAAGAGLAGTLQYLCLTIPQWPLHPIGLLLVGTVYLTRVWTSIFIGWLLKMAIVRYGGVTMFRHAKPFFLGLIVGEVMAGVLWVLIRMALWACGHDMSGFSGVNFQLS